MSAWGIGSAQPITTFGGGGSKATVLEFLGRFTKWIPGDVIALYAATIALQQPQQPASGTPLAPVVSPLAWVITLIATPLVVWTAASLAQRPKVPARMAFAAISFVIWSSTVPHSAWESLKFFNDNQPIVYLLLGVLALILPPWFDKVTDA